MDLYDAASSLQRAQDRYQCWREMRSAVTALPPGSAIPAWIRETATAIQASAALQDRDQASIWIAASERQIRHDLRRARIEHWYQQGKALRYALILCRNRVQRLATEFRPPSPTDTAPSDTAPSHTAPTEANPPDPTPVPGDIAAPAQAVQLLQQQVQILGLEIATWQARRRPAERICSLHDLQEILADPQHAADKEPLEGIINRGRTAGLPLGLPCIRFCWDTVSGEIARAEVIAGEGPETRPGPPSTPSLAQDADQAA